MSTTSSHFQSSASSHHENTPSFTLTDRDFEKISERVFRLTGIVLKEEKKTLVYSRLAKRLRALNLDSFEAYESYLNGHKGPDELTAFINAVTTNLTRFFREEHHFNHVKSVVIPNIVKRYEQNPCADTKRVRFWSAGCSSGEEPYSLAMVLSTHLPPHFDVKILATDIDTNMVKTGEVGFYKNPQGIPQAYLGFCDFHGSKKSSEEGFTINAKLKNMITFKHLNLLEEWPMKGPFTGIFCRNVVIYFNKDTQKVLFSRMTPLIEPRGWLYIGHSESLFKVCDDFSPKGQTIYQKETPS